ncbi:MAG: efflux RND transporter periplasmic adaptor subunit [SAR324 cluster bacterium]|nr:efflux RND transporter periplasmic adaptor subunit [SAR324 cluster bacterium]
MNSAKNPLQLLLLFVLMFFLFTGCEKTSSGSAESNKNGSRDQTKSFQKKEAIKGKTAALRKPGKKRDNKKRTNVRVQEVNLESLSIKSTYVGNLLPNQRVIMRSEIDGVIENIYFDEGDEIVNNKKLIDISTKELSLKLKIAFADSKLAETNLKRDEKLAKDNLIPNAQLDQTRTFAERALLNRELAKISLNKSIINSPLSGTVKTRFVKVGEFVRKGDRLVEILNVDRILVKVNIPEQEILQFNIGQKVDIELYILEKKLFEGKVKKIGLEADASNRTFPVEIEVNNRERILRPGMLARVTFNKRVDQDQVVVPRHTILERDSGRIVYVVDKGKAFQREVSTGISQREKVQILTGLGRGEQLVVEGHTKLTDGEEINIVQ